MMVLGKMVAFVIDVYSWVILLRLFFDVLCFFSWRTRLFLSQHFWALSVYHAFAYWTNPYLNFFRNHFPFLNKQFDLTPLLALFVLDFFEILFLNLHRGFLMTFLSLVFHIFSLFLLLFFFFLLIIFIRLLFFLVSHSRRYSFVHLFDGFFYRLSQVLLWYIYPFNLSYAYRLLVLFFVGIFVLLSLSLSLAFLEQMLGLHFF